MYRNPVAALRAEHAAICLRHYLGLEKDDVISRAAVLGTGWNELVNMPELAVPFTDLPSFQGLGELAGHRRRIGVRRAKDGTLELLVFGRVHLNESCDPSDGIPQKVRLMVEMLCHPVIDIKELVLTAAVGGLNDDRIKAGDAAIVNALFTKFAPDMPMYAGEFRQPTASLDLAMRVLAHEALPAGLTCHDATHCMMRGPFFESLEDKKACKHEVELIHPTALGVISMSCLPELCIASLYDVKTMILCFVTNGMDEVHSHETNQQRANEKKLLLSAWLENVMEKLARRNMPAEKRDDREALDRSLTVTD